MNIVSRLLFLCKSLHERHTTLIRILLKITELKKMWYLEGNITYNEVILMKQTFILGSLLSAILWLPSNAFAEETIYTKLWDDEAASSSLTPSSIHSFISGSTNVYTNYHMGLRMSFSNSWKTDMHQPSEYIRLYDDISRIDITHDDLRTRFDTYEEFLEKTLVGLRPSITTESDWTSPNGLQVRIVENNRPSITSIPNDLTHYTYFFVLKEDHVYTIQLKTNAANILSKKAEVKNIISNLDVLPITFGNINKSTTFPVISKEIEYVESKNTLRIGKEQVSYGLFENVIGNVKTIETDLGSNFGSVMFYKPIDSNFDSSINSLADSGKASLATFHFKSLQNPSNMNVVQEIIEGNYDSYITNWAEGIKATGTPVFVRLANEMNGHWVEWSHLHTYNDPDLYKLAYRHVADIYRTNGATNAKFVWNPNDASSPDYSWNNAPMYYPGDDYVDWVGLTAYNFAEKQWSGFEYFDQLYSDLYKDYLRMFPDKPFMIGEFASAEENGNKAFFIKEMFEKIPMEYPNIKSVIWFNYAVDNRTLPFDTTSSSKLAFKEGLKHESVVQYSTYKTLPKGLLLVTKNNSQTPHSSWTMTGVAKDSAIKNVSINGERQEFSSPGWRQFDKSFSLQNGLNIIQIEIEYQDNSKEMFPYYIYKKSSFAYTYKAGYTPSAATLTDKAHFDVLGLVKNNQVSQLKINGTDVPIQYSWRQFYRSISLQNGINTITLQGFNSSGIEVTKEQIYIFKETGVQQNVLSNVKNYAFKKELLMNGTYDKSLISNLRFGGTAVTAVNDSFNETISLDYGNNTVFMDAIYKTHLNGTDVEYPIHKPYTVQSPIIDYSTRIGFTPETAGQFDDPTALIAGLVQDKNVKAIQINGEPITFLYTWKQFAHNVALKPGMNKFTVIGFADLAYAEKITEETIYLFNTSQLVISNPKTINSFTAQNQLTITGMVPNAPISSVRVNGISQTLNWSWKQFDQLVSLPKQGNNKVTVEAIYSGIDNGRPYQLNMARNLTIHRPSFQFDMPFSHSIPSAPQTSQSSQIVSGTVIDTEVASMKINNTIVPISADKSFSYTVSLNTGLNAVKLVGYSDTNHQTKIFEETIFYFNDKGFIITKPEATTTTATARDVTIAGELTYNFYKSIKINGQSVSFLNQWRQFNNVLNLGPGDHVIKVEATWQHEYEGQPYTYIAKKTFTVKVPDTLRSFELSTTHSTTIEGAPTVDGTSYWLGGFVKDSRIGAIKVNGDSAKIEYSWRQFGKTLITYKGLNKITVSGYKDDTYSELIEEETFYFNVPDSSIINFKLTTPSSPTIDTAPVLDKTGYWLGGMVKNPAIQAVKINGLNVPLEYSWKQFGTNLSTVRGINTIHIQGYSDLARTNLIEEETFYFFIPPHLFLDFNFTTPLGTTKENPAIVTKPSYWLGGLVKDSGIKGVKINGVAVPILHSWRQIERTLTLTPGLNEIIITGYSDTELTKEIITVKRYISISPDYFVDFSHSSSLGLTSDKPVVTNKALYWIGGFVKNSQIQSMKINNAAVSIEYSWRQFDYYADLKPGLNTITITGYSDNSHQTIATTETKYLYLSN